MALSDLWTRIYHERALFNATTAAIYGIYNDLAASPAGTKGALAAIYFDPADYQITGMTLYMRIRALVRTNATAPGCQLNAALYADANTLSGASATAVSTVIGAIITGSQASQATPAAATSYELTSTFTAPAAGIYIPAVEVVAPGMATLAGLAAILTVDVHNA